MLRAPASRDVAVDDAIVCSMTTHTYTHTHTISAPSRSQLVRHHHTDMLRLSRDALDCAYAGPPPSTPLPVTCDRAGGATGDSDDEDDAAADADADAMPITRVDAGGTGCADSDDRELIGDSTITGLTAAAAAVTALVSSFLFARHENSITIITTRISSYLRHHLVFVVLFTGDMLVESLDLFFVLFITLRRLFTLAAGADADADADDVDALSSVDS